MTYAPNCASVGTLLLESSRDEFGSFYGAGWKGFISGGPLPGILPWLPFPPRRQTLWPNSLDRYEPDSHSSVGKHGDFHNPGKIFPVGGTGD